ncbi:hypothetical protein Q8A67_018272 [Cirrhinus molitorella]|uniref:Uncharacterized protein n=1 Tax=Cirrhinus molitorella TaxID=172907 RepID=A0AA88PHB5_9TELE|nr:hypothetical protein Q8A67_018272 [Cirrhinus molitorella]
MQLTGAEMAVGDKMAVGSSAVRASGPGRLSSAKLPQQGLHACNFSRSSAILAFKLIAEVDLSSQQFKAESRQPASVQQRRADIFSGTDA